MRGKSASSFAICHLSLIPAGLFLARVALEATRRPWPALLVVTLGLLAALGGLAGGRWLARRGASLWPAWLSLAYVVWPQRDPLMAASVAIVTALTWLLSRETTPWPRRADALLDGATFIAGLIVYAGTAAPDVLPADAGEFQLVAARLGVAHPPGFPLYTLAGHAFVRLLPWGTPAYRLNLLCALLAAVTLVLVARATRLWAQRLQSTPALAAASGLAAALALGTATTFWAQATIANIRTPATLFVALMLYALSRFASAAERKDVDRALLLFGLALGLGLGHHPSVAFPALFFVMYVVLRAPQLVLQPRRWWRPVVLAGLAGLLPLAYLPIRGAMGAPLAPPGLNTWRGFVHHALARGFAGDMFAYLNIADLPHRLALLPTLFRFQFNTTLLVAASLGLVSLVWRNWRLSVLLAGSLAIHTFVAITYRAPQTVEYLMPGAYPAISVAIGLLPGAFAPLMRRPHRFAPALLCSLTLVGGFLNGWTHGPSFIELSQDRSTRQTVAPLLDQAPPGALVLADWRWATPLWYLQQVEGQRPDVEVRYVYNVAGEEYRDTWKRRVLAAPPERPLLLTHFFAFEGYTTEPWAAGFLLRPRPVEEPQAPITPLSVTFGETIRLLGYSLRPPNPRLGETVEITLVWQALRAQAQPTSFTLRLASGSNNRLSQADQSLSADVAPGEVRFERLILPLYPTLAPGRHQIALGAYTATEEGFGDLATAEGETVVRLTELTLAAPVQPPFTLQRQAVPFSGGPTLVGVDYDRSVPDILRVYLHWQQGDSTNGWQVMVQAPEGTEAVTSLPPTAVGAYQTIAVDLTRSLTGRPWLTLNDERGEAVLAAGPGAWPLRRIPLPAPRLDARFVLIGRDVALIEASVRTAGPGDVAVVDVTLVALHPLTNDDATSVRLMDADGRWLARHDMQPGLGAMPTLKWIRGSRVVDRHLLPVPESFDGKTVQAALVVYERFRQVTLPPMDGRFVDVPLGTWAQP